MANDEVAKLQIIIEASMADFSSKMSQFEKALGSAGEKANQTQGIFDRLSDSWKTGMTKAVYGLVSAYAGFEVVNKVVGFVKSAHTETQKYNTAVEQLSASLGIFSEKLVKQAEALEKTKFVEQTDILLADQRLANYIKEEENIKKLIPAVIDLSRAKGIDLVSAANMVAMAYNRGEEASSKDEVSMGRLGIRYKKTGDETRDVVAISEELNKKFGKQSQAVADSLDGWSKLSFRLKSATLDIGKLIFGVSKSEGEFLNYQAALELVAKKATLPLDKVIAWKVGFVEATDEALKSAEELIKNYEEKRRRASYDAVMTANLADRKARREHVELLNKELSQMTLEGQRKLIADEMKAEINKYGDLAVIHKLFGKKLVDIDKKIKEESRKVLATGDETLTEEKGLEGDQKSAIEDIEKSKKLRIEGEKNTLELIRKQRKLEINLTKDAYQKQILEARDYYQTLREEAKENSRAIVDIAKREKAAITEIRVKQLQHALSDTVNNLSDLASKHKEYMVLYKTFAIANTIWSTWEGAQSVFAGFQKDWPQPLGFILGTTFAAAAVAAGLSRVQEIANQKFGGGGRVYGKSHDEGGVNVELEGDEHVINKHVSRMYGHRALDAVNRGLVPAGVLQSYATGSTGMLSPRGAAGGAVTRGDMTILNFVDAHLLDQYLASAAGRKAIVNVIRQETFNIKKAIGVR
jgi:hypothetical protein